MAGFDDNTYIVLELNWTVGPMIDIQKIRELVFGAGCKGKKVTTVTLEWWILGDWNGPCEWGKGCDFQLSSSKDSIMQLPGAEYSLGRWLTRQLDKLFPYLEKYNIERDQTGNPSSLNIFFSYRKQNGKTLCYEI